MDVTFIKRYKKNMKFLKQHHPHLYEAFMKNDVGENWDISVVQEGKKVNLFMEGKALYTIDINKEAQKSVENFAKSLREFRSHYRIFLRDHAVFRDSLHFTTLNKILHPKKKFLDKKSTDKNEKKYLPLLVVYGVGLAYHIVGLARFFRIRNLVLVDQHIELIRPMLYLHNLEEIFKDIQFIAIVADYNVERLTLKIKEVFSQISEIYVSHYYEFVFYESRVFTEVLAQVHLQDELIRNGWGFFDDEIYAIKHTLQNIAYAPPFYISQKKSIEDVPVFIVGSGPSLDETLETIYKYKDQAIIFSCGTALKPLVEHGIWPDFEFILERLRPPYDALRKTLDEKELLQLRIIGANLIWPEIFAARKNRYMVLRSSDVGSFLFPSRYRILKNTGPTVTNLAFSFALEAGFKKIYLFGVDLGFRDKKRHHAKSSLYHTDKDFDMEIDDDLFLVPGNFGKEVYTNQLFAATKESFEKNIRLYADCEVFNTAYGAKIEGAKPLQHNAIDFDISPISKKKVVEQVLGEFDSNFFENAENREEIYKNFFILEDEFSLVLDFVKKFHIERIEDFYVFIEELYEYLEEEVAIKSTALWALLRGTLYHALAFAHMLSNNYEKPEEYLQYVHNILVQFLQNGKKVVQTLKKETRVPIVRE